MKNTEIAEALASNFMLISLTVRKWSGKSVDRKATEDTLSLNHATAGAGKFIKSAMAGADKELKQCNSDFDAVRTYLYANSLPYSTSSGNNTGPRLVSTAQSMEVLKGIQERINTAEASINSLLAVYDERRNEAMQNLGALANASDYPTGDELRSMFGVHVDVQPVPATGDFSRTSIPAELAQGLGDRMARQQNAVMQTAIDDIRKRVLTEVKRIAVQMRKYGDGEKTRLYETLTTNITGLVQLLDDSNVSGNSDVDDLVKEIRDSLCTHSISDIKKKPSLATEVAQKAERIAINVDSIEWF